MARVAPSSAGLPDAECTYRLGPAEPLPTLDLSLSVESRFLGRRALARMRRFVRRRALIGSAAAVALVAYFVAMLAPARLGRIFGLASLVLWTPAMVASVALLRVDVVRLLVTTYDFWLCTLVNVSTYCVLGALLGDVRAAALVAASSGIQMNILVDANIRAIRVWAALNAVGVVNSTATWLLVSLALVDDVHDATLLSTDRHELLASTFVASGLLAIDALVARNVFRQRAVFSKRANRSVVECVSYRANLRLCPTSSACSPAASSLSRREAAPPEYLKTMRYVEQLGEIDARHTLLQIPAVSSTDQVSPRFSAALQLLGALALVVCGLASHVSFDERPDAAGAVCLSSALVATSVYCATFAAHYQRALLRTLFRSFDFLFLYALLAFAHLCACDLFRWQPHCVTRAAASWLWIQWSLCLDAVPPAMRRKLGVRKPLVVAALTLFAASSCAFLYMVVFAKQPDQVFDRTVTLGVAGQLRLVPAFLSCSSTAFSLLLRLLWRAAANPSDVLLVLDGAVVYDNYLRTATNRLSRRWGSRSSERRHEQLRAQELRDQHARGSRLFSLVPLPVARVGRNKSRSA